jgi:hypothetical protein
MNLSPLAGVRSQSSEVGGLEALALLPGGGTVVLQEGYRTAPTAMRACSRRSQRRRWLGLGQCLARLLQAGRVWAPPPRLHLKSPPTPKAGGSSRRAKTSLSLNTRPAPAPRSPLRRVGPTDKRQQRGFLHYGECGVSARAHSRRTSDACNQVEPPRCSLLMVRPPIERAHVCHQHRVSLPLALADKRGGAATGFEPRGKGSGVPVRLCCRHQVRSDSTPCKLNKPTRRATTVTLSWGTLLTQHHVLCSEKTALDVLRAANWSLEARTHPHVMP